jgi:DNA-binding transcriptional LysR family regulator
MRQLLAVQRHGSFAKAAQALGMSQPALSDAIRRLEDQLKVVLVDRTSAGSQLTPIGELIADRAGKVVAETEQIVRDAELVAGGDAGMVRIGVGSSLRQCFLPRFVSGLARDHPSLSLHIEVLDRDRLLPLVRDRVLDLAIAAVGEDVDEDLMATEVLTTHTIAVAHPDHPLVGEREVSLVRFAGFPGAGVAQKEFSNARLLPPGMEGDALFRYRSNDYDALLEVAYAGVATLVAPTFVVQEALRTGRLKRIDLDWSFRVTYAAIATRAASYSPIISRIVREAAELGAALQDEASREAG